MRPTAMSLSVGILRRFLAIENVDGHAAFGRGSDDRSQCLGYASAAADYFADVFRIDDELDDGLSGLVDKEFDRHTLRFLHEFPRKKF
jgi:hypothetical protein